MRWHASLPSFRLMNWLRVRPEGLARPTRWGQVSHPSATSRDCPWETSESSLLQDIS